MRLGGWQCHVQLERVRRVIERLVEELCIVRLPSAKPASARWRAALSSCTACPRFGRCWGRVEASAQDLRVVRVDSGVV